MKKILTTLSLAVLLCVGAAAFASDTATLYKSRCAGCHGADGAKSTGGTEPIKGMPVEDMVSKMKGYADGTYGGKLKHTMEAVAKKLSAEEIQALAEHVAKL
jgi:cytochrome c